MASRQWRMAAALAVALAILGYAAAPYLRAGSLFVRTAHLGGRLEQAANASAQPVTILPPQTVPTRSGSVPAQFYRPARRSSRTVLLVPGIHSMGIREPRLTALAQDLAGSGITVMTLALPDLQHYRITVNSTDVI